VLVEVAERLRSVVRADDIVARVGGDEFVIVSIGSPASELLSIAERALSEVRRPIDIAGGVWVEVSASIGVARSTIPVLSGDEDLEAVLAAADDAMYRAKRDGKNQVAEQ
jgi:diguanylate cyclase (GGDEF)-like protein